MWFWFALTALICWSGSDLFSKIGCRDADDPYSHLKMVMAVGAVMGLHAAYEIFVNGVPVTGEIILTYLPVSALYILSMAIGYLGLRYIELSISSPICNSSGAIVAILTLITAGIGDDLPPVALVAVALVCVGVIALGWVESREDEELRRRRQDESNYHYAKSALAIAIPVIYCLLDALGTFADSRVLDRLGEELADACNVAYELTFLAMGIVCAVYRREIHCQAHYKRRHYKARAPARPLDGQLYAIFPVRLRDRRGYHHYGDPGYLTRCFCVIYTESYRILFVFCLVCHLLQPFKVV